MQSIETLYQEIYRLPPKERQKLFEMLDLKNSANGNDSEKHFQKTATDEEWKKALHSLANEPVIDAPDIPDEVLRRENIYSREDDLL